MLEGLDSIDWAAIPSCMGSAEFVPHYLRDLAGGQAEDRQRALGCLYSVLFEQGVPDEPIPQSLPFLFELAIADSVPERPAILRFLAEIAERLTVDLMDADNDPLNRFASLAPTRARFLPPFFAIAAEARPLFAARFPSFVALLGNSDPAFRAPAFGIVAFAWEQPEPAAEALIEALQREDDGEVKAFGLRALGRLLELAPAPLAGGLDSRMYDVGRAWAGTGADPGTRLEAAALALRAARKEPNHGDIALCRSLVASLDEEKEPLQPVSIIYSALHRAPKERAEWALSWFEDPCRRDEARDLLSYDCQEVRLSRCAAEGLVKFLSTGDARAREDAARILPDLGSVAASPVRGLLTGGSDVVRRTALDILDRIRERQAGWDDPPRGSDKAPRGELLDWMGTIKAKLFERHERLQAILRDGRRPLQEIQHALAAIDEDIAERHVDDPIQCLRWIERLGAEGAEAAPLLRRIGERVEDGRIRVAAARALWKVTGSVCEALPAVVSALPRIAAAEVLEEMGPAAAAAAPVLVSILDADRRCGVRAAAEDDFLRYACARALKALTGEEHPNVPERVRLRAEEVLPRLVVPPVIKSDRVAVWSEVVGAGESRIVEVHRFDEGEWTEVCRLAELARPPGPHDPPDLETNEGPWCLRHVSGWSDWLFLVDADAEGEERTTYLPEEAAVFDGPRAAAMLARVRAEGGSGYWEPVLCAEAAYCMAYLAAVKPQGVPGQDLLDRLSQASRLALRVERGGDEGDAAQLEEALGPLEEAHPDCWKPLDAALLCFCQGALHRHRAEPVAAVAAFRRMLELEEAGGESSRGLCLSWARLAIALVEADQGGEAKEAFLCSREFEGPCIGGPYWHLETFAERIAGTDRAGARELLQEAASRARAGQRPEDAERIERRIAELE